MMFPSLCTILQLPGRDLQSPLQLEKPREAPPPTTNRDQSYSRKRGTKWKNIRQVFFLLFFFLMENYRSPLKKKKKKDLCWREGTEDFGSLKCSVQARTHFDMCSQIHPSTSLLSLFSSIFTSKRQNKPKSVLSTQAEREKTKKTKISLDPWAAVLPFTFQTTAGAGFIQCQRWSGGMSVCWRWGGSRPRISLPGALSWWLRRLAGAGSLHHLLGLFLPHAALSDGLEQPEGRQTG